MEKISFVQKDRHFKYLRIMNMHLQILEVMKFVCSLFKYPLLLTFILNIIE